MARKPTRTKKKVTPSKEKKILRLDLGCGQNCKVGEDGVKYTGVDIAKCEGVDIIWDLTKFPYPFEDESVSDVFTSHFIEHLDGFERMKFFNEMYRILIPGGKMEHHHPYGMSTRMFQDPTHKWPPIVADSYAYFDKNWRAANKLDHYPLNCDFEYNIYYVWQNGEAQLKSEATRTFWAAHYWNIVADLLVKMTKR